MIGCTALLVLLGIAAIVFVMRAGSIFAWTMEKRLSLDPETEAEICQTVRNQAGKLTVLAITHQPAWVAIADRVYRVVEGAVETSDGAEFTPTLAYAKP